MAVVAVAYGTGAPSLGVAEFAPSADRTIEPPPTTSAPSEGGPGGQSARRPTTTTAPATSSDQSGGSASSTPTTTKGRARLCYGDPPRQIPDPRSPACLPVAYEGPNGGATSAGVSETEIRVAWPLSWQHAAITSSVLAVFEYFNQHFELYGRRLVPVPVVQSASSDPAQQRAAAADLGSRSVFAALEPPIDAWYPGMFQELARQKVVSVALGSWSMLSDRETFDALHPFVWSVYPSVEQLWTNTGSFVCNSLVGRAASHAGPSLSGTTRKFGIVATGKVRSPATRPLVDALASCDVDAARVEWLSTRADDAALRTALGQLKDRGVTTVICACADNTGSQVSNAAAAMSWTDAEWLGLSTNAAFDDFYLNTLHPSLRPRMFGIQPLPKVRAQQNEWWYRAASEIDPTVDVQYGYYAYGPYEQLLLLAAGIQAAGPNLTPDTFAAGLMSAQFANTGAGAAPEWLPSVGFGPGDHSFANDYAVVWWSPDAPVTGAFVSSPKGSWCYLDQGARYTAGRFPRDADQKLFDTTLPCR